MLKQFKFFNSQWQLVFLISAIVFILSTLFKPYPFSWLVKIVPIVILIAYTSQMNSTVIPRLFVVGLVFSMFGDFILDNDRQAGFLYGLGAFFIAHIFYISSLGKWNIRSKSAIISIGVCIYISFMAYLILPHLGSMLLPVVAYFLILVLMCFSTLFCRRSNIWLVLGGISFLVSDSVIGLNKFYTHVPYSSLLIMTSYYFAQYALVLGFSRQNN